VTYQVLARKWRPKTFAELSGQDHVVRALSNALERGRLHHAYLLTGTRGVGKTTIARILAKSLNCINGVTATPCGVCAACTDVDAGRFVDLLELDAASNTGIDNMREILDNARYAPTVGRYKVYLIDEVHMLSKAAFNSMLKTLEEPPEHVKFVLATTDPQKIPVTVLSRCLQFNLKALPIAVITQRLSEILVAEDIGFDAGAVEMIARAAHGSMRDALSILDQAIAYGAGEVRADVVRTMLGVVDSEYIYRLADALIAGDGPALLAESAMLIERTLSLPSALDELAMLFHRIAVAQTIPDAIDSIADGQKAAEYAKRLSAEAVQLAYQICVQGRADLALAPDEPTGFTMTLLRLLAFEPVTVTTASLPPRIVNGSQSMARGPGNAAAPAAAVPAAPVVASEPRGVPTVAAAAGDNAAAIAATNAARAADATAGAPGGIVPTQAAVATLRPAAGDNADSAAPRIDDWPAFVAGMKLAGIALQLASQTELKEITGNEIILALPEGSRHLSAKTYVDKLRVALEAALGRRLRLRIDVASTASATLAAREKQERLEARAKTEAAFRDDPFVKDVLTRFEASIRPDSIKPQ
jgi:DNA polymerase III subunit gamma/tau